ncbi:MAG: amidohydrolase family protein [Acidimicrobiales bacterium]
MALELFIDVDTHITEPPDTWSARVPAKYQDLVPYTERNAHGLDHWYLNGERISKVGLSAVAGFDGGPFPDSPKGFDDIHPASIDANERLAYMDSVGIWAQVLYPNVAGFGSQIFLQLNDPDLMRICVEAYNDFQTDWASADPRRLLPVTATPFWDVDAAAAEIRRCAERGHKGVLFTGEPQAFGLPYLGDRHWDPIWATAQECGMPVSFHIGSGDMSTIFDRKRVEAHGSGATYANSTVTLTLGNGMQVGDLLLSGVLPRFPDLQFVSVESGIGWVPFVLETCDYAFVDGQVTSQRPEFGDMLPSDLFRRQVYVCYWFEQIAPRELIETIGADRVLFETDFPHPTCLYGEEVRRRLEGGLGNHDLDVRRKILWDNAQALYQVDEPTADDLERIGAAIPAAAVAG